MARLAGGAEVLKQAKVLLAAAKTIDELRMAQAVVLPLERGFSMEQTAQALGVSRGWACRLRQRFIADGGVVREDRARPGGRRRQSLTLEEEREFLVPFFEQAQRGGILVVGGIKRALDQRLGREVALGTAYNLLHRHGWRKLAPDKRHPKSDPAAQADWKKNSPASLRKSSRTGRGRRRSN